jgi:hypothetical protein
VNVERRDGVTAGPGGFQHLFGVREGHAILRRLIGEVFSF